MIALVHGAPAWGAVEEYVAALATALGDEAVLVHPGVERFDELGVRTITFPADASNTVLQTLRLAGLLRRLRPRVVHVTDVWPQALVAARLARVPRLLLTHHTPELPRNDNAVGRAWWRLGWAARPEVIYTSESQRRADGRRPSQVIELGIDLDRFSSGTPALAENGPLVGNVARLSEQKGHRYLLEAAARIPEAQFAIVGDGELRADLERQARELGVDERVRFTGTREDVPALLASFDVFAFPSLFEGLCLAVIEAQVAGVPVVATPVGGIRETVVDGQTGLLVPPRDPDALAAAIRRLLEDRDAAGRMAAEARVRARERFSLQRMVERTLELYGNRTSAA
jgi:glycosyltransferase involved in cell wall biosynthesis